MLSFYVFEMVGHKFVAKMRHIHANIEMNILTQ